jgi:putative aldouronate transport system permease protein
VVSKPPVVAWVIVSAVLVLFSVPLLYTAVTAFLSPVASHGPVLRFGLRNLRLLAAQAFIRSLAVSLATASAGALLSLSVSVAVAYGFFLYYGQGSRSVPGTARVLLGLFLLVLVFNGGIVPLYMVVRHLGLVDTYGALFIPYLLNFLIALYCLEQFRKVPQSLLEAARLEGLGELSILFRLMIPLKLRLVFSLLIVHFVLHWNNWYPGVLFINSPPKQTVQVFLRNLLFADQAFQQLGLSRAAISPSERMTFVFFSILPTAAAFGCLLWINRGERTRRR